MTSVFNLNSIGCYQSITSKLKLFGSPFLLTVWGFCFWYILFLQGERGEHGPPGKGERGEPGVIGPKVSSLAAALTVQQTIDPWKVWI